MTINVYNTLSRKKEKFVPLTSNTVNMYVCGPTVYDSCHIGHARSVIVFDVIVRYFKAQSYQVKYVRNFTDVDDKIIRRANLLEIDTKALADKYIKEFYDDMDALNVDRPDQDPRVTDSIDHIIQLIIRLLDKGYAYHIDGNVYFAVESYSEYGKLSGRRLEEMEAGARVDIDRQKRNPFDFALWKASKPDEPFWDSPWGSGRPGWHIECSAMSWQLLGETFDIHGGGKDLIFPHHENEIAQSEAVFDKPYSKYWMHNGFVNINQEKMSKSKGNFLMVKDILKTYHPEAVRLFLLSNHYRSPIDFTDQALKEATMRLDKIYTLAHRVELTEGVSSESQLFEDNPFWNRFCQAMDDDFNTALGIGFLFDLLRNTNRLLDQIQASSSTDMSLISQIQSNYATLYAMGGVIGILTQSPDDYIASKKSETLEERSVDPQAVDELVAQRTQARQSKDWAVADKIRQQLNEMGVQVEDRPEGAVWRIVK
ncbi:cysteine--tRNA ligase [Desulfococcaceae bacterium HSG9]|nr:cysteine--tRNA ligase [Desulfococcaceae bacterium HSG9]